MKDVERELATAMVDVAARHGYKVQGARVIVSPTNWISGSPSTATFAYGDMARPESKSTGKDEPQ